MKKVYVNKKLFIAGVIYCTVCVLICAVFIALSYGGIIKTDDPLGVSVVWAVLGLGMVLAGALCMPRWSAYVRFEQNCAVLKVGRKREEIPYEAFKHIYMAHYIHRSIFLAGIKCEYIVLSKVRLSAFDLEHINLVSASDMTIKIRSTSKVQKYLEGLLPCKQRELLLSVIHPVE